MKCSYFLRTLPKLNQIILYVITNAENNTSAPSSAHILRKKHNKQKYPFDPRHQHWLYSLVRISSFLTSSGATAHIRFQTITRKQSRYSTRTRWFLSHQSSSQPSNPLQFQSQLPRGKKTLIKWHNTPEHINIRFKQIIRISSNSIVLPCLRLHEFDQHHRRRTTEWISQLTGGRLWVGKSCCDIPLLASVAPFRKSSLTSISIASFITLWSCVPRQSVSGMAPWFIGSLQYTAPKDDRRRR